MENSWKLVKEVKKTCITSAKLHRSLLADVAFNKISDFTL